jgi:hypothetical protein
LNRKYEDLELKVLSLMAFAITATELTDIAAAAIIGSSVKPITGINIPVATGIASKLYANARK